MKKSTKWTLSQRVNEVSLWLIGGCSRGIIVLYSAEKWQVGERQTDKYIQKAKELIKESVKKDVSYEFAKAVRRYEDLYWFAKEDGDIKTALAINKEITNLNGLLKTQVEHSGSVQFISNIPD